MPKVLFIDDSEEILEDASLLLASEDYELLCFNSFKKVKSYLIEHGKADDIRLIISDQNIGDGTGNGVLQIASIYTPNAKRVILSGEGNASLAIDGLNKGLLEVYVEKGVDWINAVKSLIENLPKNELALNPYHTQYKNLIESRVSFVQNLGYALSESVLSYLAEFDPQAINEDIIKRWLNSDLEKHYIRFIRIGLNEPMDPKDVGEINQVTIFTNLSFDKSSWQQAVIDFRAGAERNLTEV